MSTKSPDLFLRVIWMLCYLTRYMHIFFGYCMSCNYLHQKWIEHIPVPLSYFTRFMRYMEFLLFLCTFFASSHKWLHIIYIYTLNSIRTFQNISCILELIKVSAQHQLIKLKYLSSFKSNQAFKSDVFLNLILKTDKWNYHSVIFGNGFILVSAEAGLELFLGTLGMEWEYTLDGRPNHQGDTMHTFTHSLSPRRNLE